MNNILYQTVGLYTERQRKGFIDSYIETQNTDLGIDDFSLTDLYDYEFTKFLEQDNEIWWQEVSSELHRLMKNKQYQINADLGFWNGRQKSKLCSNGFNAIIACIGSDSDFQIKIFEERGTLKVDYFHHDGVHHFTIKEKTSKGLRSPRLLEKLYC